MNIVLMGYRGTGKSVVGKILSKQLKRPLFSIDRMIMEDAGCDISDIVEQCGWPRFREMEADVVSRVAVRDGCIIDCGGGVVLNPDNVELLKRNGKVVLLDASLEVILERLQRGRDRPPLTEGLSFEEEQKKVYEERAPLYSAVADMVCDTSRARPGQTVQQIIERMHNYGWI
ncbi:Shikimate kinase [Nitrospina gracilis 3/211]|uniref:Shikimate kinase n=1 Tax=Nitrospina gracilis (strain 3/211) TaxID=1266370 RepID=M1YV12_NITG3|nr:MULTISPECIES: shikimate kinase [Nitrospina]MCF8722244.1 shikimate kinase [Nitrospina sp. Nb-3]CCQ89443.1 Shikimate kinase [Nitrospina gracilis 3/211]